MQKLGQLAGDGNVGAFITRIGSLEVPIKGSIRVPFKGYYKGLVQGP